MSKLERISDAFLGGPAHPMQEPARFYQQARWLGECAEYIYPPPVDHSNDARMEFWEPIWNSFIVQHAGAMVMGTDAKVAREKWESAVTEFVKQLQAAPSPDSPNPAQVAYAALDENGLDAIADKLQRERRELFPKWLPWKWFTVTAPMREASQKYELAHRLWSTRAESRIREYIIDTWAAKGSSTGGVTTVEFNSKNGIEYFLASNDELVILCFRGTEMRKWDDIITDMRAWQVEIPEKKKPKSDQAKALSSITGNANTTTKLQAPKFHEGFWIALHGVWEQIEQNAVWKSFKAPTKKQVWITGHSLGGALATLAAYRLVRDEVISADQISGVFTFGQPRVGDGRFVGGYTGTRDRHYRFINNCDVVTMIPPKSLRWLILAGSLFFKRAATIVGQTDSDTLKRTYEYADVGNIYFLNRGSMLKPLQPGIWWPLALFYCRVGSLLRSPFVNSKHRSVMERFIPGIADHSMQEYNRVIKIACAHSLFVQEAVATMKAQADLQSRHESVLQKAAERAWKRLRTSADRDAWDAKMKVNANIAAAKTKLNQLEKDQSGNASAIAKLTDDLANLDKLKAKVWLETWHAVLSKNRDEAIESAVANLRD